MVIFENQKFSLTLRSVSLGRVRLCTVLAKFWICGHFNFRLRTVLASAESLISQISSRKRILSKLVQPFYQGAQMAVLACAESLISQISSRKRILSKPVQPFYQGAQMASIHEIKNYKKSCDTTPLKQRVGWLRTTKFCKNHKLF